jgi:hypothetical protein
MARQPVQVAANVLRDAHYVLNPATAMYEPSVLLEGARTNIGVRSEPTVAQLATSSNVADATGFASYGLSNGIAFGANSVQRHGYVGATLAISTQYTVSFFVVMDDGNAPVVGTGTTVGDFCVVINATIVNVAGNIQTRQIEGALYRITATATTGASIISNSFGPIKYTTQSARTFKVSGYQLEQAAFASSYYRTTGSAAARSADAYFRTFDLAPAGMLLYCKHVEQGAAFTSGARLWQIGDATDINPRILVYRVADGRYAAEWDNIAGTARASSLSGVTGGAVAIGNLVETVCVLLPTGVIQLHQSVNEATPVSATASAALTLPSAWSAERLYVNSIGASAAGFNAFMPNNREELVTVVTGDFSGDTASELFDAARTAFMEA